MHSRPTLASLLLLPAVLLMAGCGYVHVGRLPDATAPVTNLGDDKLLKENSDLRLEKKILQQELALTRAQGDALRTAIENRTADGDTSRRLAEKLTQTSRELADLRNSYVQLKAERATAAAAIASDDPSILKARLGETEEKLAVAVRTSQALQQEVDQLKTAVARSRAENLTLAAQARVATAQSEQAQAALAKLNLELVAQKDARVRAEQDAETLRNELRVVAPNSSVLAQLRTGTAADARSLSPEPAAESSSSAAGSGDKPVAVRTAATNSSRSSAPRITLQPSGINATFVTNTSGSRADSGAADSSRVHTVAGGDTLAKISTRYYGTPSRWNDILSANRDTLGENNSLVIGRTLRIP